MNGHKMGWVEERIGEMSVLGTGAYWGEERTGERSVQRFWWRDLRKRDRLECLDLEMWITLKQITLKQIYKKWIKGVCWIVLVPNRDIWFFL